MISNEVSRSSVRNNCAMSQYHVQCAVLCRSAMGMAVTRHGHCNLDDNEEEVTLLEFLVLSVSMDSPHLWGIKRNGRVGELWKVD